MSTKADLQDWVECAIRDTGGRAKIVEVAKHIWENHESELKASRDIFYTWQYDMRWAANQFKSRWCVDCCGGISKRSMDT